MSATITRTSRPAAEQVSARGIFQTDILTSKPARVALAVLRLVIGFTFLWPFLDKLFGLGYSTASAKAWVNGGTPAQGFLKGVKGPFADLFHSMASPAMDYLFMAALLGIGVAVILGVCLKLSAICGSLLVFMMWLAEFPIGQSGQGFTNPVFDDHWLEGLILIVCALTLSGDTFGLGRWWGRKVGNGFWR